MKEIIINLSLGIVWEITNKDLALIELLDDKVENEFIQVPISEI